MMLAQKKIKLLELLEEERVGDQAWGFLSKTHFSYFTPGTMLREGLMHHITADPTWAVPRFSARLDEICASSP